MLNTMCVVVAVVVIVGVATSTSPAFNRFAFAHFLLCLNTILWLLHEHLVYFAYAVTAAAISLAATFASQCVGVDIFLRLVFVN